jgi:hypothetical protein
MKMKENIPKNKQYKIVNDNIIIYSIFNHYIQLLNYLSNDKIPQKNHPELRTKKNFSKKIRRREPGSLPLTILLEIQVQILLLN